MIYSHLSFRIHEKKITTRNWSNNVQVWYLTSKINIESDSKSTSDKNPSRVSPPRAFFSAASLYGASFKGLNRNK